MNITTGINKFSDSPAGGQVSSFKFQAKSTGWVGRLAIISILYLITGCASRQPVQEDTVSAKSDVKVVFPVVLSSNHLVNFRAVTRYMQANDIRSQVTGIVRQINCTIAGNVSTGQALFIIQPQEAAALQKSKYNTEILKGLSDTIFAQLNGQINSLNVQVGDFVQSGNVLATCIRSNSMRLIAYIPVEKSAMIEKLKTCKLILPDGSSIGGRISGKLSAAQSLDQTEAYIIEPSRPISLAENINLSVQFIAEQIPEALFVPENAIMGNEEQTNFWVMKLMNDSTCIKVPVEKGLEMDSLIQLIGTSLTTADRVISEGGYGLADSAMVQVVTKKR